MMKKMLLVVSILVGLVILLPSGSAFANKDLIYPSGAAATVDGTGASVDNDFVVGDDGSTTIDNTPAATVYAGSAVSVNATWSIQDRSAQAGQDTSYGSGLTATFSSSTNAKPSGAPNVSVNPISNCMLASSSSACHTIISFAAPTTTGNYQLEVTVSGLGGSTGLATKILYVNFTVAEQEVQKIDTQLTVAKKCFLLNQGDVNLTTTLQESSDPFDYIADAPIEFYINPQLVNGEPTVPSIGIATTDDNGVATLTYNINGLGVGTYTLYAEFDGNDTFNPSNDSDVMGINYLFVGFQPPINADGTSIFGGRVIPIKIKLVDANGAPVTDAAPTVWLTSYDKDLGVGADLEQVSSVSSADTGNIMRYVPDEQKYIYNWDATDLPNGTYAVVVDLGDSTACRSQNPYAIITVAKKGRR
jgi:hypothetical protein